LRFLGSRIEQFDIEITRRAKEDEVTRRLTTIPGWGPVTVTAIAALAPAAESFQP
jgi:transposase